MTDQDQGHVQPDHSTSFGSHPPNRRIVSASSVPRISRGSWPDPALPQSLAVNSTPTSPYFSQTQFMPQSSSQVNNIHVPPYPSQTPVRSLSASVPLLKPPSSFTGYSGLGPPTLHMPNRNPHAIIPSPAPPSSAGLSYVSSIHLPMLQNPVPTPVPVLNSPSVLSLPSHTHSPPFSIAPPHSPIAPVPLRAIPFHDLNRIMSPSFHTPLAPAPPYFPHQFNPVQHPPASPLNFNRSFSHTNNRSRSLSRSPHHPSSPQFPIRPASLPRLSPISPILHQLPYSPPAAQVVPITPLTVPNALPTRPISTYTKPDFPSLSSIPILSSASDWTKWHSAVIQVIEATGLFGHIADVLPTNYVLDPTAYPSLPPVIDRANFTSQELEEYKAWWTQDDIVSFVLVGKLGPTPLSLIPPKRNAWGNPQRTARDILRILRTKYGVFDASSAALVREFVLSKKVIGSDVSSYVDLWRRAVLQVEGTHWDFSSFEKIQRFADGLPRTYEYGSLRVLIREGFNSHPPHGVISFHDASQAALNIELASRRLSASHGPNLRRSQPSSTAVTSNPTSQNPSTTSLADAPGPTAPATRPRCSNCGALGHVAGNCWEPGGGDVGGRDRYLAANPPRPRAHVATAPDTLLDPIVESTESEIESAPAPIDSYTTSDAPPINFSDSALYLDFAQAASPIVLASLADRFNAILDSGCTVHIIRDRSFFWTYDTTLAVPVGTANCGTLETLAKGEVRFRVLIDGVEQIIALKDCLHAPDVPVNLLSVGSMTEKNIRLVFEKNWSVDSRSFVWTSSYLRRLSMSLILSHLSFFPPFNNRTLIFSSLALMLLPIYGTVDLDIWVLTIPGLSLPSRTDYATSIKDRDERLVRLRAARASRSGVVHPQQTLPAIVDFLSILSSQKFDSPEDDLVLHELEAIAFYKSLAAHPHPLRRRNTPLTFNLDQPPATYEET
ncbi:hypothetical protein D9615_003634 [Tricholomella constricta]|uniref:CCHC-type domain-containing protein n=1 Tax=Tricholomella constricta TaxID=117010 RepID=A0A8H5HID8_9AGAR|nr:hypothetical protein D9615_003634 [Tricholomella constricta]